MPKKKKTYVHPDTSRAQESKSVHFNTKELNIKKQLEKKIKKEMFSILAKKINYLKNNL